MAAGAVQPGDLCANIRAGDLLRAGRTAREVARSRDAACFGARECRIGIGHGNRGLAACGAGAILGGKLDLVGSGRLKDVRGNAALCAVLASAGGRPRT